jgi:cyclase
MLKKRIIACFDIKNGRAVKGVQFMGLKDAGNPVALAAAYAKAGIDELVFLDITATLENRKTLTALIEKIAAAINIPFTVGGGINSVDDAERIIRCGADKISINSSAIRNPGLISEIAARFGSQAVAVAIDTKFCNGRWEVFANGGTISTGLDTIRWAKNAEALGAGELLLTSMNNDGTKDGFAIGITKEVCNAVNIPVIASGGAGEMIHFSSVFKQTDAGAALAASVFHFGDISIGELKRYLITEKIAIR